MRTRPTAPFLLAALVLLASCGPLVQIGGNDTPPASLLTLRATATPVIAAPAAKPATVMVVVPAAAGALQTLRVPVAVGDVELQYLVGATWSEQPNRLFRRVLADTIVARGLIVIDPRGPSPRADMTLSGTLTEFGLDVRTPDNPHVNVRYDAVLNSTNGTLIAARRFDASAPVAGKSPAVVGAALNDAANRVAGEVADWVATAKK
ncbi:ABC transporter [Polymorphobacter arshaanensis]|uniref:ABC transporter n=1 Tax=Glacieibacterium arshaanense TaxID=2511025 RepID=A0A4Y9ELL7_9SPHN|nr:ABC-type transport auxiliary lipoprotein family protein [Polymorphobacter arshaanensis]TFU01336.1 ABC transporter [Polymorphobacter arshaanensis]